MLAKLLENGCSCAGQTACLTCLRAHAGEKRNLFSDLLLAAEQMLKTHHRLARNANQIIDSLDLNSGEGVLIALEGRVVAVNEARLAEVGLREDELLGQSITALSYLTRESQIWSQALSSRRVPVAAFEAIDAYGNPFRITERRFEVVLGGDTYTVLVGQKQGKDSYSLNPRERDAFLHSWPREIA